MGQFYRQNRSFCPLEIRNQLKTISTMKKLFLFSGLIGMLFLWSCDKSTSINGEDNTSDSSTGADNEETVADSETNNATDHEEDSDYTWETSSEKYITLNGSSIDANVEGASASGSILTITEAGNYNISGNLTDGQIIVNAEDEDLVRLILSGVDITSSNSAPIYIKGAEKVIVVLTDDTSNTLTDGSSYVYDDEEDEEPNATLFSKTNLTLFGGGELTITGNFNDAINCKDGLIITSGTYNITAVDDGIRGKDYLIVNNGTLTVDAVDDGLKSDNDNDTEKGYINVLNGTISIEAGGDAITAETDILVQGGTFNIVTNGSTSSDSSTKGIKAGVNIIIEDGTFIIESNDDAIHSNETITISGGTFTIDADDDGIHADYDLTINDGDILIQSSYEGIESASGNITINGGEIDITSSDDGINVSAGGDSSGGGGNPGGGFRGSTSSTSSSYYLYINGGTTVVNATGDGIDSNGSVEITDGTVIVNGPTSSGNGALDYDASFYHNGGILIAVGSSGMFQTPSSSSDQKSVVVTFRSTQSAGTLLHLETGSGDQVFTFEPAKKYQAAVFSFPSFTSGTTFVLYKGGSISGEGEYGLYTSGTYSGGSEVSSFTVSNSITSITSN